MIHYRTGRISLKWREVRERKSNNHKKRIETIIQKPEPSKTLNVFSVKIESKERHGSQLRTYV